MIRRACVNEVYGEEYVDFGRGDQWTKTFVIWPWSEMYRLLVLLAFLISHVEGDCLYPEWKTTCQKYCMENQLYEIQLNQCYSRNPDQLTCKCSGQVLTNKIKEIIQSRSSSPSTSTSSITDSSVDKCIPSKSCTSGKVTCSKQSSYCTCQNGTWMEISCPEGSLCNTASNNTASCQPTSILNEKISPSSSASSIKICEYFCIFLCWMLIK